MLFGYTLPHSPTSYEVQLWVLQALLVSFSNLLHAKSDTYLPFLRAHLASRVCSPPPHVLEHYNKEGSVQLMKKQLLNQNCHHHQLWIASTDVHVIKYRYYSHINYIIFVPLHQPLLKIYYYRFQLTDNLLRFGAFVFLAMYSGKVIARGWKFHIQQFSHNKTWFDKFDAGQHTFGNTNQCAFWIDTWSL